MKLKTNLITQLLGLGLQSVNLWAGFVPPKAQVPVAIGISIAQAIAGVLAHFSNPDGTSASTAYVAPDPAPAPKLGA